MLAARDVAPSAASGETAALRLRTEPNEQVGKAPARGQASRWSSFFFWGFSIEIQDGVIF